MNEPKTVFTPAKVDYEHQKIEDYLAGRPIFPTTIELDLTQLCSRNCDGCPYGVSRSHPFDPCGCQHGGRNCADK